MTKSQHNQTASREQASPPLQLPCLSGTAAASSTAKGLCFCSPLQQADSDCTTPELLAIWLRFAFSWVRDHPNRDELKP
jgi:hypothetical protein